ncbi:uncharacterized protein LOC135822963 [Sycon ciliatum]|eukprot:scpid19114/ scgid20542/ Carbonic anhydrase-related protein 10; Carbonic anhydrase-related protein X; Cerebral protein 15 &gt; Carbonic anhydrase-related protein 10; Carbonic anhydrase-related protein X; Carbonic anhydrase-related protein 10 &gt; Carbonic anhydrase-related protein 10
MTRTGESVHLLLFSLVIVTGISAEHAQLPCTEWSYADQDNWPDTHCTGNSQSGINIETISTAFHPDFSSLAIDTAESGVSVMLHNDGHHVVIRGNGLEVLGFLSGGPLYSDQTLFSIVEARFHFGVVVDGAVVRGSDHLVDGNSYAAELQFIAFNTMYPSMKVALTQPGAVAIVSVLFELGDASNNVDLNMFLDTVASEVTYEGNSFGLDGINLRQLLPLSISDYYTYSGSFSWPKCSEDVTWLVMSQTLPITLDQMNRLQGVFSTRRRQNPAIPMAGNTRQTQELNSRQIISSFPTSQAVSLGCNHQNEQISLGQTHEFFSPDASDPRSTRGGNDIIFLVDQSGSSRIRRLHSWLRQADFAGKLDTALTGLGFSNNQFGMVGFGQDQGGPATTIEVGGAGQLLGSAEDLQTAFQGLTSRGSREDGYAAIQLALRAYDLRPNAHCILLMLTDEGRDNLAEDLNYDLMVSELNSKKCVLHVAVHERFASGMRPHCGRRPFHRHAFGMDAEKHSIIKHSVEEFQVVPWAGYARLRSGNKNTHTAYVQLAWATGGSAFNVIEITDVGSADRVQAAATFSNILAQLRMRDLQRYSCQRCRCTFAGQVDCRRCDEDFPPQAVVVAEPATVFLGDSGTLRCIASGHPAPTIAWQRPDGSTNLPPGVTPSGSGDRLNIRSVTERNCFTCVADGGRLGENEAMGCVEVQGVIPVPELTQPQSTNTGGCATFTCTSSGYPEPRITLTVNSSDCVVSGNTVSCDNLQATACVTCNSENRLGSGEDTKCVNVFASCPGNIHHNSWRRQFSPDASIPADNMHLVIVFDESRTMLTERGALPDIITGLDTALMAAGFGVSIENKYSLVGFAGSAAPGGKYIPVGNGICGGAAEVGALASTLGRDGRTEDGYSGINVALQDATQCDTGPNSQLMILIMTDEDRDVLRGVGESFTYSTIVQSLRTANARFSAIVKQQYRNFVTGQDAYGLDSKGQTFIIAGGGQEFELTPPGTGGPIRDSGFGTTEQDYVELAQDTGGCVFDVLSVRNAGRRPGFLAALSACLSEQLSAERVRPLCQECLCNSGELQCNNLPRITDRAQCTSPSDVNLGVSVRSDPPFAVDNQQMTLFCESSNERAVAEWVPHPIDAFQIGRDLHLSACAAKSAPSYMCVLRTGDGQDSDSISVGL